MKALAMAGAVLGLLAGIIIAVLPHGTRTSHTEAAATASPISPVTPTLDLSSVRWTDYQGYQLPVSAQAGPRDTSDDLASGFADTPTGALLAVINVAARTAWQFGPAVFQPTIQDQVTGPYETQMLSADQDSYAAGAAQAADIVARSVIAGYQWVGYTPGDATVDVVGDAYVERNVMAAEQVNPIGTHPSRSRRVPGFARAISAEGHASTSSA